MGIEGGDYGCAHDILINDGEDDADGELDIHKTQPTWQRDDLDTGLLAVDHLGWPCLVVVSLPL